MGMSQKSWFPNLHAWSDDFLLKDRVVCVDIEGVPPLACIDKMFLKIASK